MRSQMILRIMGFVIVLGVLAVVTYQGLSLRSEQRYQISVNGVFVLVDQENLLSRINTLALNIESKTQFISELELFLAAEPYIYSSSIRYAWPNEVIIDIDEINPTALISGHGFLSEDCRVIAYEKSLASNIHVFELDQVEINKNSCQQIMAIHPYLNEQIRSVSLISNGDYRLKLDGVEYVISDDFEYMFDRVWRVHRRLKARHLNESLIVDLRYRSGSAIRVLAKL